MWELIYTSKISEKIVYDLFDGVESDLKKEVKINTKKELFIYSYRVAGTVGLMMAKILNVKNENSLKAAIDLGIAMQLTNISRDVVEDSKKNRKYIDSNFEAIKNMYEVIDDTGISKKVVYDLFDGVESDLKNEVKIKSKKELLIYSYRVAGTVGLMMAKILEVKKQNALKAAIDLGKKFFKKFAKSTH